MTHLVIEPHPSVPGHRESPFISSGRGGAGNFARYNRSALTHGPEARGPAKAVLPPTTLTAARALSTSSASNSKPRALVTGRGGAGNVRPIDERRVFDFEDELKREQTRGERMASISSAVGSRHDSVVHIGRGGAGNAVGGGSTGGRQGSIASSRGSVMSGASAGSENGWRNRLSRVLTRE